MSATRKPRELPLGPELGPTIKRFRKMVAASQDALLTEGPVHADHELLDLCAEALHLLVHAERARDARPDWVNENDPTKKKALMALDKDMLEACHDGIAASKPRLIAIAKIKATTPAGVYAKALVVKSSVTGAAHLAKTLAEDMIACEGLRASLWPAEVK